MTGDEIAALWVAEGGDPGKAQTMAAIALTESGGDPNAVCYDYKDAHGNVTCSPTDRPDAFQVDVGLWQVGNVNLGANATKADGVAVLSDPQRNAQHAVSVLASQGLGAWSSYGSAKYQANLAKVSGTVSAAVQRFVVGDTTPGTAASTVFGQVLETPATAALATQPVNTSTPQSGTPGFFGPVIDAANSIATEVFLGAAALALLSGGILWLASTDSSVRGAVKKAAT